MNTNTNTNTNKAAEKTSLTYGQHIRRINEDLDREGKASALVALDTFALWLDIKRGRVSTRFSEAAKSLNFSDRKDADKYAASGMFFELESNKPRKASHVPDFVGYDRSKLYVVASRSKAREAFDNIKDDAEALASARAIAAKWLSDNKAAPSMSKAELEKLGREPKKDAPSKEADAPSKEAEKASKEAEKAEALKKKLIAARELARKDAEKATAELVRLACAEKAAKKSDVESLGKVIAAAMAADEKYTASGTLERYFKRRAALAEAARKAAEKAEKAAEVAADADKAASIARGAAEAAEVARIELARPISEAADAESKAEANAAYAEAAELYARKFAEAEKAEKAAEAAKKEAEKARKAAEKAARDAE